MTSAEAATQADPRIGRPLTEVDTPTLILDRAASDRNLAKMAAFFEDRLANLRPHFKNHKCVALARRQIAAGAIGMTCATLNEAQVLVAHGFDNLLIANQVVGEPKMARLANLAKRARITVAIDHPQQAAAISRAATAADSVVHVLIEVDIGMGRCGVPPGEPAVELAKRVAPLPGISLAGLQAYEGHLINVLDRTERASRAKAAMQKAIDTRRMLAAAGIGVSCISGCASATYDATGTLEGVDEVQAGTYATMDRQYHKLAPEFEMALSVLVRVISRPDAKRAVLDVGVKGVGSEFGAPAIRDFPDVEMAYWGSEEHAVVGGVPNWRIGEVLQLIPSHACTTCNLYSEMVIHEAGRVVDVWPIEASGRRS